MISDDADELTDAALEQDPDSESEAIILLSHRMATAKEMQEDLNTALDDELARHNRARDVQVTVDQFMMLPQSSQNASALIIRFVRDRPLFTETLAHTFLEAYVDPYHPPFPLFSDIG